MINQRDPLEAHLKGTLQKQQETNQGIVVNIKQRSQVKTNETPENHQWRSTQNPYQNQEVAERYLKKKYEDVHKKEDRSMEETMMMILISGDLGFGM